MDFQDKFYMKKSNRGRLLFYDVKRQHHDLWG